MESYGTTNGNSPTGLSNKWTTSGSFTIQAGRIAGKCLQFGSGATIQAPDFTAQDTWTVGFGYYISKYAGFSQLGTEKAMLLIKDGGTGTQVSLYLKTNGEIKVYRNDQGSLLGTTAGAHIRAGHWNYIEIKVKINNTTGTVDLKVNNVSVLSLTSQNTRQTANSQASRFVFSASLTAGDLPRFDDIYICDNQGSNNTSFLGPQKVTTIFPTGDNGTNQWTTSGSGTTHADRVKENPHDSSTTYLTDTVSGHTEEFDYANTGSEVTSIKGVQMNTVFETDDASAFSVKNHVNSGGTSSDDGGTAGTNGTYKTASFLVETDPNTSALWTKTNLDAALFGVKVA